VNLPWLLASAALGAALAAAVNWAADCLPRDCYQVRPRLWQGNRGSLLLERHALVTLACLAGSLAAAAVLGATWSALWLLLWGAAFLLVAVVDFEHRLVLNKVLLAMVLAGGALSLAGPVLAPRPPEALAGGAVGLALFGAIALLGRGAMGAGDVKLAAAIGLIVGYPQVVSALFLGVVLGGLAALVAILRGLGRKAAIPYAPWLALGAVIALARAAAQAPL